MACCLPVQHVGHRGWRIKIPHDGQVILFPHEDNCIQGIFHMRPWPNFPPWPCLDSQLPSNTELSLLCHNDEPGRTLRLRTNYYIIYAPIITHVFFIYPRTSSIYLQRSLVKISGLEGMMIDSGAKGNTAEAARFRGMGWILLDWTTIKSMGDLQDPKMEIR